MKDPLELRSLVDEVLRQVLALPEELELADDTQLQDDLGIDSMKLTQLALELEVKIGGVVLLNQWLERNPRSEDRTIGSLVAFLSS